MVVFTLVDDSGRRMPAVVLEGGMIFSIRTRLRVGIKRLAICASVSETATVVGSDWIWVFLWGRRRLLIFLLKHVGLGRRGTTWRSSSSRR